MLQAVPDPLYAVDTQRRSQGSAQGLRLLQLALAQDISLAPGPIFSATQRFRNCARLNHGHPWDSRSEKAMEVLGRIVRSL